MTPAAVERVFGRERLKMVTGQYAEVFREAAGPGERRRYTKRFLATREGDFREWTEREWRLLARLVGHGVRHVPEIVQYARGPDDGSALVQTYDAGVTVDHWATLLPVERDGRTLRHVFQDCAHWWALARHFLLALKEIHQLQLVHLDIKADNVCIPLKPPDFDPHAPGERLSPDFEQLALIDFAFSLVSGERLASPLPIGWQREFPYQSPRLLQALAAGREGDLEPTRRLDWRCDMYSLAAMLRRYLPAPALRGTDRADGWTGDRHADAKALLLEIVECHDREASGHLPHQRLVELCDVQLGLPELADSLQRGWTLASRLGAAAAMAPTVPLTPMTRIEPATRPVALVDAAAGDRPPDPATAPTDLATVPLTLVTLLEPRSRAPVPADEVDASDASDASVEAKAQPPSDSAAPVDAQAAALPAPVTDMASPARPTAPDPADVSNPQPPHAGPGTDASADAPVETPASRRRTRALVYAAMALVAATVALPLIDDAVKSAGTRRPDAESGRPAEVAVGPAAAANARLVSAPQAADVPASSPTAAPPDAAPAAPPDAAPVAPPRSSAVDDAAPRPAPATAGGDTAVASSRPAPAADPARSADDPATEPLSPSDRAATRLAQVLVVAAQAQTQDKEILDTIKSVGPLDGPQSGGEAGGQRAAARRLNAAARDAFWTRRDVAAALELQQRAFDADPQSAEIAGNLAFYHLKSNPPQPESARRMALHALAVATASGPGRVEDWGSLAVASALSGRQQDATNAMVVMLAVSKDLNRACKAALNAFASFGQEMKAPAEALLARVRARGQASQAPYCAWPPNWSAGMHFP